jgi:manganese transport protein
MTSPAAPSSAPFDVPQALGQVPFARPQLPWARALQIAGPGLLVSVGYMDPGNWATDIEAGSRYGYELLFVVLVSSLAAMLLQVLSLRLGLASGMDLARACRQMYSGPVSRMLWIFGEVSIAACDLAELLGSALALHLLLHVSLMAGLAITALDTFVVLWLGNMGFRTIEAIIFSLVITIAACYGLEMILARPDWAGVAGGFLPDRAALSDPHEAFVAIGIVGATVMPHNLYLHSSVVLAKREDPSSDSLEQTIRLCTTDTMLSLTLAMLVNAAILVLAASAFHATGHHDVVDIADAYRMLDPLVGSTVASLLFAIALLASGQSATLTGTIAGQVILEGFLDLKIPDWQRRLITRLIAIVPAVAGLHWLGPESVGRLLVASQVVLSLQLPFALWPLLRFNGRPELMGTFAITKGWRLIAWAVFCAVTGANLWLICMCLS